MNSGKTRIFGIRESFTNTDRRYYPPTRYDCSNRLQCRHYTGVLDVSDILQQTPKILADPAPVVGISALHDSSISLSIKPWVKVEDFVAAQAAVYQAVVENFRDTMIEIPVPRRDIRILNP